MEISVNTTHPQPDMVDGFNRTADATIGAIPLATRLKNKVAHTIPPKTLQLGLDEIFKRFTQIKPFVLTKLVRDLIDAQTKERMAFTLIAFLDLYSEYLPSFDAVSPDALNAVWGLFKYCQPTTTPEGEVEGEEEEGEEEYFQAEAFVRKQDAGATPELDSLCQSLGLDSTNIKQNFAAAQIPLMVASGLLGVLALFFGDKLVSLVFDHKKLLGNLSKTAKAIKDLKVVHESLGAIIQTIMDFVGGFFGYTWVSPADAKKQEILTMISDLKEKIDTFREGMKINATAIIQSESGLQELEREVRKLEKFILELHQNADVMFFRPYLNAFNKNIIDLKDHIMEIKHSCTGKCHPTVIYISGDPGIGKSEMAKELIKKLEILEQRPLTVYTRNSTDEFWANYAYQDVVVYDDFGQHKKNQDHNELIGIYTCASYQLVMSESKDKGRHFTSPYVIMCSNHKYIDSSAVVNTTTALDRRRDILLEARTTDRLRAFKAEFGHYPRVGDPPAALALYLPEFAHLQLETFPPDREAIDHFQREMTNIHDLAQQMFEMKAERSKAYERSIQTQQSNANHFALLREYATIGRRAQQQFEGDEYAFRNFMLTDDTVQNITTQLPREFFRTIDEELFPPIMEGQSLVTERTGKAIYFLYGPAGCGKSHLLNELGYVKINCLEDVMTGNTLLDPVGKYHFEDASVTEDRTSKAMDVVQRLYDHKGFGGILVVSANPDMLMKNLAKRGTEAIEMWERRGTTLLIHARRQFRFSPYKAEHLEDNPQLTWDSLYYAMCQGDEYNAVELKLKLTTQKITVRTFAVFDYSTIEDFNKQTKINLDFPNLDWDTFTHLDDYTHIRSYLTPSSILRAGMYLRDYASVLVALPRRGATPEAMAILMNQGGYRVPKDTPSAILNFKDFKIRLINHQSYCMFQITSPTLTIPNMDWEVAVKEEEDEKAVNWYKMLFQFGALLLGSTLIFRELFGYNQGKQQDSVLDRIESLEMESRKKRATPHHAQHQIKKIPRSAVQTEKPKKDYDEKREDQQMGTYDNESKNSKRKNQRKQKHQPESKVRYDTSNKPESRKLTHTDLGPREEIIPFDNLFEIDEHNTAHVKHWKHIIKQFDDGQPTDAMEAFTKFLQIHKIPETLFHGSQIHYTGISHTTQVRANEFIEVWKTTNFRPESMADPQAASLIPLVEKNQVFVYTDGVLVQRALMIHGREGITVSHGVTKFSKIEIPGTGQQFAITITNDMPERDIAIFQAVKQCPQFRDIRSFIRSKNDNEYLDGTDCFLISVHADRKNNPITRVQASRIKSHTEIRYDDKQVRGFLYAGTLTGFHLNLPSLTEKGFCGSPTLLCNTRYPRKIISIHAAGNNHSAFGIPIYAEYFSRAYQGESLGVPTHIDSTITRTQPWNTELPPHSNIKVLPHQEITQVPNEVVHNFNSQFELDRPNSAPTQTNIFRSPLKTDYFGDNFEPAILSTYDTRNVDKVDINAVTIEKWARAQPECPDETLLDKAVDDVGHWLSGIIKKHDKKQFKLTKTEALNRTTYYSASQPIPRDTSAGYPWKHYPNAKGKEHLIKPRIVKDQVLQTIPDDENGRALLHAVDNLTTACARGERTGVVFNSSAKDEVIKKSKIYPCRTRGFAGAPLDFTIAHRQYFHTAMCALMETRAHHPIKVGIEAVGDEWDDLWRYLAEVSTVGTDFDFRDWDSTIPIWVMKRIPRIYNAIYNANPKTTTDLELHNKIRTALHTHLHGPLLTYCGKVVEATGGQVSGQPATTIDNCIAGLIIILTIFYHLAPPKFRNFAAFLKFVRVVHFGDDIAMAIATEILDWFNQQTIIQAIWEFFGMVATPASKKEGDDRTFKPLLEIEFLKRNFIKIGPRYYGKIQPSVFDKMLNWTHTHRRHHYFREPHKVHYDIQTIEATIDSLLYELCLYPPNVWKDITDHLDRCLTEIGSDKILPTQNDTLEKRGIPHKLFHASLNER